MTSLTLRRNPGSDLSLSLLRMFAGLEVAYVRSHLPACRDYAAPILNPYPRYTNVTTRSSLGVPRLANLGPMSNGKLTAMADSVLVNPEQLLECPFQIYAILPPSRSRYTSDVYKRDVLWRQYKQPEFCKHSILYGYQLSLMLREGCATIPPEESIIWDVGSPEVKRDLQYQELSEDLYIPSIDWGHKLSSHDERISIDGFNGVYWVDGKYTFLLYEEAVAWITTPGAPSKEKEPQRNVKNRITKSYTHQEWKFDDGVTLKIAGSHVDDSLTRSKIQYGLLHDRAARLRDALIFGDYLGSVASKTNINLKAIINKILRLLRSTKTLNNKVVPVAVILSGNMAYDYLRQKTDAKIDPDVSVSLDADPTDEIHILTALGENQLWTAIRRLMDRDPLILGGKLPYLPFGFAFVDTFYRKAAGYPIESTAYSELLTPSLLNSLTRLAAMLEGSDRPREIQETKKEINQYLDRVMYEHSSKVGRHRINKHIQERVDFMRLLADKAVLVAEQLTQKQITHANAVAAAQANKRGTEVDEDSLIQLYTEAFSRAPKPGEEMTIAIKDNKEYKVRTRQRRDKLRSASVKSMQIPTNQFPDNTDPANYE